MEEYANNTSPQLSREEEQIKILLDQIKMYQEVITAKDKWIEESKMEHRNHRELLNDLFSIYYKAEGYKYPESFKIPNIQDRPAIK
jgi:hypothetical protein